MKKHIFITIILLLALLTSCGTNGKELPKDNPGSETPPVTTPSGPAIINSGEVSPKDMKDPRWPVPIMYHLIMEEPYSPYTALFVKPADFKAQIAKFCKEGYDFVFADEYKIHDGKGVVLTFDDGYEDNYSAMFPVLKEYNAHATIFLIENLIGTDGYLTEEQIKEMADSGLVHFGWHTQNHTELPSMKEGNLRKDLEEGKLKVEELTGMPCRAFAYPGGKYDSKSASIVEDCFDFAYTTESSPTEWPSNKLIPRVYAARGDSAATLLNKVKKMADFLPVDIK